MNQLNTIVIPDNAGSTTFATVVIILTLLFVIYEIATIAWQDMRGRKLKKLASEISAKSAEKKAVKKGRAKQSAIRVDENAEGDEMWF